MMSNAVRARQSSWIDVSTNIFVFILQGGRLWQRSVTLHTAAPSILPAIATTVPPIRSASRRARFGLKPQDDDILRYLRKALLIPWPGGTERDGTGLRFDPPRTAVCARDVDLDAILSDARDVISRSHSRRHLLAGVSRHPLRLKFAILKCGDQQRSAIQHDRRFKAL
jgi:hypothetical protein